MGKFQLILIPRGGHLLTIQSNTLPAYSAFEAVLACESEYMTAEKSYDGEWITLNKRLLACASCGATFPFVTDRTCVESVTSQNKELEGCDESEENNSVLQSARNFLDWALQFSLPGFDLRSRPFVFHPKEKETHIMTCPYCGYHSRIVMKALAFEVYTDKNTTEITQRVDYGERRHATPLSNNNEADYPLALRLIFDHETHRTALWVVNRNYEELTKIDITDESEPLWKYQLTEQIALSPKLRNALTSSFSRFYPNEFPFSDDEITLGLLVMLNRFQGFPRDFYSAIPVDHASKKISDDFAETLPSFSVYSNIPLLYNGLGFPAKKALRKVVFENPGLLFYADQLKKLPFHNLDILLQILRSQHVFQFLSILREYPGVLDYVNLLIASKGEATVWRVIRKNVNMLPQSAAIYFISSPSKKEDLLQKNLHKHFNVFNPFKPPAYSFPVRHDASERVLPCSIDGYEFKALKNSFEYAQLANALQNCLADYPELCVVGVNKQGRYVAAIRLFSIPKSEEVCVIEAKLSLNLPVREDRELYPVYKQWLSQNNLTDISNDGETDVEK